MNFTTSTTAISRAYREPKRRECMSAKVLGHDVEAVELIVERLLRQAERFARRGRVAPMPSRGAHVLLAAGDDHVGVAALECLRSKMNGLETAAAHLADGHGRHHVGEPTLDRSL